MPTLEDILKLTKDKGSINIVPLSKGQALTQEEIQAMNNGINNYLSPMSNPDALIKDPKTNTTIDTSNIQSKTLYDALHAPNATPSIESIVQSKKTIDFNPDVKDEEDISDQLARYDFPLYAETDDLNEARAYNAQSNTEAMIKGAKNIIPVAIGVGAQMLGGTMQIANNMLGDDDFDNPITKWGRDYMKNNMNIIYQNPNGNATSNAKSLIAAGSDILGQFGSAIGSMIAISPANAALIKSSVGLGSAVGGPMGGILGGIAGSIAAAAMNAYAEGVIDAADVYDKKYKELWNKTHNMNETQKVAKLAAQTVANQNMILNTALNIIPVMWSVKPYGLDKSIKNALGLPEVESKWFRLQKPYAPNKLATETFDEYADRIAKIKASGFANNEQYSLLSNPFDTLKNIGTYGKQTANSLKYNALHPIEYLNRNWDIIGETVGEGLEEYHNYFAREQGLAVNKEEDAAMIPSMSKLMKGYSDMLTKGEGAYDLIAGSIIGGMSAPIMSGFHFGRTKVYNPDNGQMEYKYKRNPALDWIPFELASDHDQKDYENIITNSLQRINDVKSLGQSYLNAQTIEEKDKVVNQLLLAPLTKYVDDGSFETFMLSLEAMKENLGSLAGSEDQIGNYLSVMDKLRYDAAMSNLENETDPKKIASLNTEISVYKDKAKKAMSDHSSMLTKRIDFLKSTAEDYRKLKDDISANYGDEDYGYANALFKNKMAFEIEQDMLKKHHQNLENVRTQFKNKIQSQNPSISEGEVYQIMDNAIKNDNEPIYKTDVENYINAKKALLESEFRMERFAQRYLSLATWGYKNEADLRRELELIEEISAFSMTDDEIRSIRDNDNDQNILMLSNFIGMLEMQLQAETDPAKKKQIQDQLNMFKQLMGNFDSNTNDALKKYLRFKSIQQELRDLMKNQVTYELDFKNNEYNYKGFTPLQKYLARNKMMADEFKKMSKAKNDIDILNTEVISVYKQYADRYSDAFTEEQKSLQAITQEFEKLRYNGVIDMTQMNDVNQWLQNHDTIYKEVRDRLLATAHKYSQPGFENPFIANYIKNIIIQMNYQKDVIDQLRQLQFQYELQLTIATSDEIIDLLNKGIITHRQAINYVNESKSITDNEKNTLKEIIAKAEEGIIHNITIRAEGYVPIAYYNNNDEILINDGQEIIYESKNDGTVSKTRKNTYSGLDTVTDKDISHYTRFDPETPIDESRLKTDIKYLSTMLRFRESLSPKDSDTLIKFINTKEFIDFIVDNIVKKDINISKTIKVILANIADIDRTSGSDDRKIIYTHAQQELLRVYLYKGDNDLEKIILLGSKDDNSSIENIDKVKFITLFNSPTTNILSQLKSVDGYQYYHVIDIIKNKSLYKVIDGKLLYFAHPLAYQYLDNPEDMKKIGDFLKDVTTDNIENKITQLNSQISSNFKIVVINPDTNTNDIYTINSEGKLNKETTAELVNKSFFDKDLYNATKPKIPSKSLKEQVLDIIKNNKVDSANINTIADDLDNITDINEVNRYIKSDSRADNYPQYLWLLYKLSDPTYFNPHLYVQLKMHHEKINDNFKQTDIYNKIKTIYEDTITSHDTEVLVHDEQGIIYTIDSVSKIIEDNSILQQPTTTNQLNALPTAGFETFNKPISTKKEINKYVAGALLKASEIFWDKNIQTTGSWIPSIQDIDGKTTETYIDIAYDSLSDENKKIAEVLGKIGEFGGIKHIHIVISNRNLSLEEIQKKSIEIANKFKSQPLLWYKPTTLQDAINSLEERRTKNPTIAEQINEEIQKIKDTWGTNLSPGEYFDNDTQTIWDSEELYKKSKGLSTSTDAKAGLERLSNKKLSSSQGEINTGKLEEAVLPNEVVEKSIAQDIDGNWIEVYINNPKLQGVLLARNGNYLFRAMQGRFFVIAKVGNFYLPFYISSAGTSGKNEGEWYPFFGYNDWLVKGRVGKKGEMEYSEKISQVQKLLNDNFRIPAKFFTQFGQIINGKGTPVNPDKVFYDISEHVKYESWFVDFDRQEDNKYTEEQFVADRTGLNPKNVVNDGKGSADSWIRDVVALTEDANTASKGIISNIQPTVSTDAKADIERRRQEELNQQTDAGYSIIALDYLFTGGRDVILSTDYLLQALVGGFTYSAKEINDIRNKYADKLGNIKDDINSDVYNQMMNEIRDVINKNYNDSKATEIFDKILKNATGFTNREGNQTSIELDKLNEQNESKINAKYDEELAKELYKEMLNGKSIADMTPYEKTVANTYITADLKRSVDAELSANEKSEPVSKLKEGEFYTDVETVTSLPSKSESTLKNELKLGKIQGTDYEIKSDGIYYKNKIIDNSENLLPLELIKRHINERRNNALADVNKDKIDYYTELKSIDAKKGTIEKVTLYKIKDRADRYIRSGKMYLFIDPELGLNSPGVNAHIELYKYDLNKKGYDFDLKKATVNLDSHTATIPIIKLPSVIDVDGKINAKYNKELKAVESGISYVNTETNSGKGKTEKEVLGNIRAYYYNLVKNSPLIGTQEGRNAALQTIERLPDLEMLVQFVRKLYTNIREADYTPTMDNPFDDNIEEITGKATKDKLTDLKSGEDIIVVNQGGWHYRQIVGVKKDPTKYRFSLNVWGNKELIKILDNIARKYGIYYKTPNSSDRWNDRHDPVTIYVSNSSLTDAQIDALKREIVEETKPYIRSNDGFGIYGENLSKGVEFGLESTQEEVNRILTEADSVNPTLGQAIRTYLEKRTDGQYKSSVGQNLAIIKAINLFKSISQPTETILPPKIYYTNKGALYSINQQGVIEEVKGYNVSKLTGSLITNEAHIKLLTALKSKKLSQPFKLKQKTGNKKTLTDVKDIAKTTFTNRLNPNDKISVEKTSNNNVHLLNYNGELLEFIPFINHNYDDEFYETLSYYYESKVKQKSPDDKEDPNQKIAEKLEQEYDKYDFSKLDRGSDDFRKKLSTIVNEDSLEFKSIVQGEIVNPRSARKNIKQGDPIITIFDLYKTGLITGKDVDDIKKQLDKFVVLFEEPVQQKIERADIADKKKLLEEQVLKFSKKTRVNYFYTNGNYIAFVKFPNDADVNGKNFIETTDSGAIEWEFISYDKLDTFLDTNAHDTSKKYYFDLNDLLNNEEFLYKLFKYKYNYLSLDTSYDLFNKHVAEIIFNILDDNIKLKLATRLVDEVLTTVDTMSLDSVKAIMVGQRIKDTDNYQVWFYTKRKNGQKISFFNEISNINKNGGIKIRIDENREVILSNGRDDLIAKVLSGELRLSINNNIKSTRSNSLQINYAIQHHSSLDIATNTNYRKFSGSPSSIRLEFEDVRKGEKIIGWKLYYKEDSYIELIQNEGRRFEAIEFRLKTKEWRQYTSYKQGEIFPFNWDEFDNFFKEVYDNLPDTFTIKELYQALFYGINKGTEFNLLLSKLKKHSDVQDDQELFKMLLIDAAQYMDSREYIVSLNGFKMIDYEARTLSKQILDEIDRHTTINDMIDNIKFVKGTSPDKITSVNNTNTVDEGEDFNESEYQKAYGQKEELVLAETAVAHSHRLKSEYTYNEFPESFNQIDSEVTLIANYNKSAVAERNESTRKILTQYSDIKSGMVIIDSTSLSGLKLTYKGSVYDINSKADYINLLEEIFDDNKNNSRFLKSERLLDILYMYDISVDERGNITGIKSKSNIIAHSNKDGRNSAISQYWNGLNSGEKDNALLLLKKLFVISRMQLAINYKNTNDEYEYLGYMHDLPYLLDPYRSISLFNETIFREPNEQLEAELSYVMNSFNKKIEIFNLLTDINQSVPVSFNFDNYGKLNTLNNTREVLAITLLKDTYQKYYISKQNIDDLYNFVLFNLADSSKNIEELYTLEKIDFFNYMYLIILPIINKLNTNNTQTNEEYFWNTFVKPKVEDINEKNFATRSGKINYIALLQSIYETPNVLSNANRKTIEHEVLSKLISTDEDNNNYKRALLNYTVIELFNPFSNKSRFYTASNITLENGTKDIFNSDTVKDSTLLDQLSAKLQVKNQVLNNVLEGAKNIILSYINNTVSNNIFNNNVLTSDDDKLTHLRNIFKTIRLRLDSNKFDDDEQILLQLSNYKGNIGSLFIVSNKKGDEERDKLVIAYKDKNTYELIIIDKNAIVHKVYDMTEKPAKSGDISKIFNKKSEIALTQTDDKITSLLKKVYLVVDGSLPEIKSNAKINDSLSSTPITKYHEYVDYIFDTNINGIEGHYFIHPVIAIEDNVPTESDITTITSPSVDNDAIVNQQGISTIYEQLPNDLKAKAMAIFNPDSADSRLYSNSDYNKLLTELYDEFIKYQSSNNMLERQNIAVNILDIIIDINELNNDLNRC